MAANAADNPCKCRAESPTMGLMQWRWTHACWLHAHLRPDLPRA